MRVRWKALLPLLAVVGSWLASPDVLQLVPDEWSHWMLLVSSLIAVVTPALITDRPPTDKVALKTDKRLKKAGLSTTHKLPDTDRQ